VALVRKRGHYMQSAVPAGVGGMMAVIGLRTEYVYRACEEFGGEEGIGVWVANDNCPGQIVVSGHIEGLKQIAGMFKDMGARRLIALDVSAPFHCPLMEPAAEAFVDDLYEAKANEPRFPVIANATAAPYKDADAVALLLEAQIHSPVLFRESLALLPHFKPDVLLDLGPKPVISGLAKRTIPDIRILAADTPDKLEQAAKELE